MTHLNDTQTEVQTEAQDLWDAIEAAMAEMDKPPVHTPEQQAIQDELEVAFAEFLA